MDGPQLLPNRVTSELPVMPKISGSATELPFPKMGRQVRMLLRKKVRYHVRAAGEVYIWGATVAGKVN